ncbi:MAG: hypothetical protein NXI31_19925 [bacterium]|nr:hypothetical protein [bacterium]
MVKQGSFFQRLKERWGSSSGVRVDRSSSAPERVSPKPSAPKAAPRSSGGSNGNRNGGGNGGTSRPAAKPAPKPAPAEPRVERVQPGRELADGPPVERRSSRKMSEREEAMLALNSQFQELSTLLQGSHQSVDEKLGKLVTATDALSSLPAVSEQQLEALKAISAHMERQNVLGEQMAQTVTKLPTMLDNVEKALERAAKTDERTAATVREFHTTMDRIHESMGKQVAATQQLAERKDDAMLDIAKGIESSQEAAFGRLRETTDENLKSLRRTHEDQSNRLQKVVQENAGWNRAVLVGIGLVVLGIGALIVLQLVQ